MSSQKPTLSFIGNMQGTVASQVQDSVALEPFSNAVVSGQHGLLIDGGTAPPIDQSTLAQVLESGGLVAICGPTTEQTALLGKITGQTPSADAAMVSFKKLASSRGYKCVVVPNSGVTLRMQTDSDTAQETTATLTPNVGAVLAQAALDTGEVGMAPPGLIPPQGVYCGYRSVQLAGTWDLGYPRWNGGVWDDNTAKETDQSVDYSLLTEWFVYWVNGGTGLNSSPYYLVIQRQTGPWTIGTTLANNQDSRGWFTLDWKVSPNNVQIAGVTNPTGMDLAAYAPKSGSSNTQIPVQISLGVQVWGQTQSGTGPTPFVPTVNDILDYPEWGVLDQTSGMSTQWEGYQITGWNPLLNPPWQDLYSNGNVVPMSDQSFGSIDFEALTCWTFGSPLFTPPAQGTDPDNPWFTPAPSLPVSFNYGYEQDFAFLHNHPGCSGNYNGTHFHIWITACDADNSTTLDLGTVVLDQGID
jgi:hypothetical protein